jgi:hypothetical protein
MQRRMGGMYLNRLDGLSGTKWDTVRADYPCTRGVWGTMAHVELSGSCASAADAYTHTTRAIQPAGPNRFALRRMVVPLWWWMDTIVQSDLCQVRGSVVNTSPGAGRRKPGLHQAGTGPRGPIGRENPPPSLAESDTDASHAVSRGLPVGSGQ